MTIIISLTTLEAEVTTSTTPAESTAREVTEDGEVTTTAAAEGTIGVVEAERVVRGTTNREATTRKIGSQTI
jgi:hypothetical protein